MIRRPAIVAPKCLWSLVTASAVVLGLLSPFATSAWGAFGIEKFESRLVANPQGEPATQAGSHPYALTVAITLNHNNKPTKDQENDGFVVVPDGDAQNVEVNLPRGLVANPSTTTVRCREAELEHTGRCPEASVVGVDSFVFGLKGFHESVPVYNMETPPDQPAEFGFNALLEGITVHILGKLRTATDYGLSAEVPDVNQQVAFFSNTITLWGNPPGAKAPFLTLPSSCGAPLMTTITANSWQEPTSYLPFVSATSDDIEGDPANVTGCERLAFTPQLAVQPTTHMADSPTGLNVEMTVPQEESPGGLAEANLQSAIVTLPVGMSVSPAAANGGLGVCSPQQIGLGNALSPSCPNSAKIGSVEVLTPLLEQPLVGSVYLAQQGVSRFPQEGSNPFGSLIALYLVVEGKGVVIKVPGEVNLDPITGQLTAQFGENLGVEENNAGVNGHLLLPELPFSRLKLDFFGGPNAALVTPPACGTYAVTSSLTPYSAPESGPPATPNGSFEIDERCQGGGLNLSFVAGTYNNQASAFSPFTVSLSRQEPEPEQGMDRIQVRTPPGLLGTVSSVPLCEEPQGAQGDCSQASLIGHVTAGVGVGTDPLYVSGNVFLTGPYDGAPFGLSIVVPAIAGPFNLGTEVVRSALNVDPRTAALVVTSDPLPHILRGIPLRIRSIHVDIDRQNFIVNPTSCAPMSVGLDVSGVAGANVGTSSRFQAANCAALGFGPKFKVSTSAHTTRANGASLDTKLTYPAGGQTNIARVKVELPKQLPSRLTTLQKACRASVFEVNPANCPAASVVGIVRATTPILPVQLTGPVYFVSHGGEAFPDIVVVVQGDGVRVDLTAATFISKKGITSSTFGMVPDVPVSSFELYFPEGKNSALAANGDLCKDKLVMPTTFDGQNGAVLKLSTRIAVTGCPKPKVKKLKAAAHRAIVHRKAHTMAAMGVHDNGRGG